MLTRMVPYRRRKGRSAPFLISTFFILCLNILHPIGASRTPQQQQQNPHHPHHHSHHHSHHHHQQPQPQPQPHHPHPHQEQQQQPQQAPPHPQPRHRDPIQPPSLNLRTSETDAGLPSLVERMMVDGDLASAAEEGQRPGQRRYSSSPHSSLPASAGDEAEGAPVVTVYRNGVPVLSTSAVLSLSMTLEAEEGSPHPSGRQTPQGGDQHGSSSDLQGSAHQVSGLTASLRGAPSGLTRSDLFSLSSSSIIDDYAGTVTSPATRRAGDSGGTSAASSLSRSLGQQQQHMARRTFPFGMGNIEDIHSGEGYYMVDKSRWVSLWLHQSPRVAIILRPRLFGKTLALSYAQAYLDHCRKPTRALLDLVMLKHAGQRQEHFHRHSIVALRFGHHAIMDASSGPALEQALVRYLESVLQSIMKAYRRGARDVPPEMRALFGRLCGKLPCRRLDAWTEALQLMISLVHAFSGLTAAVLVDDYDGVLKKAGELGTYGAVAAFFAAFFRIGLNDGLATEKLFRAAIFGVQRFHDQAPFKEVRGHQYYALGDEHDPFAREFGFTQSEVAAAATLLGGPSTEMRTEVLFEAYGGYYLAGSSTEFLVHPYGVAKALSSQRVAADYWTRRLYIDVESPPFSNLAGFGVGNLYRLAGTKGDQSFHHRPTHMNLGAAAERSSSHEVVSFLRHAGLLILLPASNDIRVVNRPAKEFMVKAFQAWFARSTGIISAWHALLSRHIGDLRAALADAWLLPAFFDGDPPHACKRLSAFKELVERSASNYGAHVQSFSGVSASRAAGNIFRFHSTQHDTALLVSFGFATGLKGESLEQLTEALLEPLRHLAKAGDQFKPSACISIAFVTGSEAVGLATHPKHLQSQQPLQPSSLLQSSSFSASLSSSSALFARPPQGRLGPDYDDGY